MSSGNSFTMDDELNAAIDDLANSDPQPARQADYARAGASHAGSSKPNIDLIMGIPVDVQVVLGSTTMPVANLMKLGRGAVVTLDKQIGDPVDIVVNGRVIARGEVIVLEDDSSRFGVSLTEVIASAG
ncbi:MAG: flagellar motor switch protein FliN [Phyllobacterium sp.]